MAINLGRNINRDTINVSTISVCERHPSMLTGARLVAINNLAFQTLALIEDAQIAKCPEGDYLQVTVWTNKGMVEMRVNYHPSNSITISE